MATHTKSQIDDIVNDPLSLLRFRIMDAADKGLPAAEYNQILGELPMTDVVKRELSLASSLVATGSMTHQANLEDPETQLIWAATILHLMTPSGQDAAGKPVTPMADWPAQNQASSIAGTPFWKAMVENPTARFELGQNAVCVNELLRDDSASIAWGAPKSWFYNDPVANRVNLDLFHSLALGFEYARGVALHELGHSILTLGYVGRDGVAEVGEGKGIRESEKGDVCYGGTLAMVKLAEEDMKLRKAAKTRKLTQDEYVRLRLAAQEYRLRHQLFNSAEDCCVNRFAVHHSETTAQDFSSTMNHVGALLSMGKKAMKEKVQGRMGGKEAEKDAALPDQMPPEVKAALETFQSVCAASNLVFFRNNGLFAHTLEAWRKTGVKPELIAPEGTPEDQLIDHPRFARILDDCGGPEGVENLQPGMHDRLFGRFFFDRKAKGHFERRAEIIDRLWDDYLKDIAQKILEQNEQNIRQQLEEMKKQNGQKGQDQQGEGQPGQGQPGQGQPGEGQPGGGGGMGEEAGDVTDGDGIEVEGIDGKPASPKALPKNPKRADGKEAKPGEGEPVPGVGGKDGEQKPAKSLKDAMDDARKAAEDKKADEAGKGSDWQGQNPGGTNAGKGGLVDLRDLAKGDFSDYKRRVAELSGHIALVERLFRQIQEKQVEMRQKLTRYKTLLPEDGDIEERLDVNAHIDYILRRKTGQPLRESDLERFRREEIILTPSNVDVFILIDGSGSMTSGNCGGLTCMESAMQSSIIINEGARRANISVFAGMWGASNPPVLARPGDDPMEVGKRLEGARQGLGCGTDLAPAIRMALHELAQHRARPGINSARSHILVLSDGDIFDSEEATKVINEALTICPDLTVDFAILDNGHQKMNDVAESLHPNSNVQKVECINETDPNRIPFSLVSLVANKMRSCGNFIAVADEQKRRKLKQAAARPGLKYEP